MRTIVDVSRILTGLSVFLIGLSVLLNLILFASILCGCTKKEPAAQSPQARFVKNVQDFAIGLDVNPWPVKIGEADLSVKVVDLNGKPVDQADVEVVLSMPSMTMGGPKVKLSPAGKGLYTGKATLSMAVAWNAKVNVTIPNHPTETAEFNFTVGN